ncbi:MAG: nucleotidyltransferase domain-containing protein [Candidatus Baldrarchaeia archaeon]
MFGSVVRGEAVGGSDVDILIVHSKIPESRKKRAEIVVRIEEKAGLPLYHPFEIHLVNKEEAKWYFRHIDKFIRIL